MRDIHWRIAVVAFVVGFCAVAAAALYYANDLWLSGVMSASIVCWLAGVLAAVYGRTEWRPVVIGALAASFLYVLLALGPWFRTNVGPWLLTTRGLKALETTVLGREPQHLIQVWASPNPGSINTGTIDVNFFPAGRINLNQPAGYLAPGGSVLVQIGHWLFGWIAAIAGGAIAVWIARRQKRRDVAPLAAPKIHDVHEPAPAEEAA